MYKRPLGTAIHKDMARPHQLMNRTADAQHFSSFESPPLSEKDNEQFSDFETSREKDKYRNKGRFSGKKERSHIFVEQMPLQADNNLSNRKKYDLSSSGLKNVSDGKAPQLSSNKAAQSGTKGDNIRQKQNCPLRYNYMQKVERHLTTIHEDTKEDLRDSAFIPIPSKRLMPRPKVTPFDNFHLWNINEHSLYNDPNIALLEKQSYEMLMLEQENISLRERVLFLQKQLRTRDEECQRKEAEIIVERMKNITQEEQVSSTRKEAKLKLVEQVAVLQSRCRQMKEQMRLYKVKQEEKFSLLIREQQDAKLEVTRLKFAHEYQAKFTQVFLNMVEKLPIDLQEEWSNKRKIAVGWKVVKHLVKKAFKLGIHPPAIAQKDS